MLFAGENGMYKPAASNEKRGRILTARLERRIVLFSYRIIVFAVACHVLAAQKGPNFFGYNDHSPRRAM